MRIVRPQPAGLRCRVRLADGRGFSGALPAARHRAIQLGLPHAETAELVELTPGTRDADGKLALDRRRRPEHYLPGGAAGRRDWLAALLAHAERIVGGAYATRRDRPGARGGVRRRRLAHPPARRQARDRAQPLPLGRRRPARRAAGPVGAAAERPCHLLIESGGSGGAHAYWKLAEPLAATQVEPVTDEVVEPIEQAHLRLINRLGVDADGRPSVADVACKERARVMRLAGTVNHKSGRYVRVVEADFALPAYPLGELVGEWPDPSPVRPAAARPRGALAGEDPYG